MVLVSKLLLPTALPEAPASLRTILEGSMKTGETVVPAANRTCRTRRVLLREASITLESGKKLTLEQSKTCKHLWLVKLEDQIVGIFLVYVDDVIITWGY